jgi:hypothetical protein
LVPPSGERAHHREWNITWTSFTTPARSSSAWTHSGGQSHRAGRKARDCRAAEDHHRPGRDGGADAVSNALRLLSCERGEWRVSDEHVQTMAVRRLSAILRGRDRKDVMYRQLVGDLRVAASAR